jgi:hypothetical protein
MKREIYLKTTADKLSWLKKTYEGEYTRLKEGKAKFDMVCDYSNEPIKKEDIVVCVTSGRGNDPGYVWENEFIYW